LKLLTVDLGCTIIIQSESE